MLNTFEGIVWYCLSIHVLRIPVVIVVLSLTTQLVAPAVVVAVVREIIERRRLALESGGGKCRRLSEHFKTTYITANCETT